MDDWQSGRNLQDFLHDASPLDEELQLSSQRHFGKFIPAQPVRRVFVHGCPYFVVKREAARIQVLA